MFFLIVLNIIGIQDLVKFELYVMTETKYCYWRLIYVILICILSKKYMCVYFKTVKLFFEIQIKSRYVFLGKHLYFLAALYLKCGQTNFYLNQKCFGHYFWKWDDCDWHFSSFYELNSKLLDHCVMLQDILAIKSIII